MRQMVAVVVSAGLGLAVAVGGMILTVGPYADGPPPSLRVLQITGQVAAVAATAWTSWRWTRDGGMVLTALVALLACSWLLFGMPVSSR